MNEIFPFSEPTLKAQTLEVAVDQAQMLVPVLALVLQVTHSAKADLQAVWVAAMVAHTVMFLVNQALAVALVVHNQIQTQMQMQILHRSYKLYRQASGV